MLKRIFINTRKHILRSGWKGIASVFVMTLAFLVVSIFGGLAYLSNLFLQYTENRNNILVFFNVGMDQEVISKLRTKWEKEPLIDKINYLSEEAAYDFYSDYAQRTNLKDTYEVLQLQEQKKLPSSLEIQLHTLRDLTEVQKILKADIDVENQKLIIIEAPVVTPEPPAKDTKTTDKSKATKTTTTTTDQDIQKAVDTASTGVKYKYSNVPNQPPITISVNNETLSKFASMFAELRIAGVFIMSLLILIVVFFIFMTSEFRLFNQMEEIGVMQLVGGSLGFIRAPYILEGGFYGFMGAFISTTFIGGLLFAVLELNLKLATSSYILENFYQLPWPNVNFLGWILIFILFCLSGFIIGAASSYLSIRRYIR